MADRTHPEDLPELDRLLLADPSAVAAKLHPIIEEITSMCVKEVFE
jgi:hypothetical protein